VLHYLILDLAMPVTSESCSNTIFYRPWHQHLVNSVTTRICIVSLIWILFLVHLIVVLVSTGVPGISYWALCQYYLHYYDIHPLKCPLTDLKCNSWIQYILCWNLLHFWSIAFYISWSSGKSSIQVNSCCSYNTNFVKHYNYFMSGNRVDSNVTELTYE